MNSKPIRVGVLSTAGIARRSVIPAIVSMPEQYQLVGIASRDLSKAKELASTFAVQAFDGYETILDKRLIDAVYIPLPNSLHEKWVRKALENNIHVLVEKSLGCSLQEVEQLVSLAKKQDLVLVENFQFRFHNQLSVIKGILERGEIGELRCFRSSFAFPPFPDADNIRYQKHLGGGALLDAGAYTTKIAQILMGEGLETKAATLNYLPEYEVDIWGGAYLVQPVSGVMIEVAFGFDHFYQCGIELLGTKGRITTNRLFTAPSDYIAEILVEKSGNSEVVKVKADNHFSNMLYHFHNLIEGGGDMSSEHSQNIDQARLIESIREKANGK